MSDVIDFVKRKRDILKKKRIEKEEKTVPFASRKSTQDKIDEALKEFGSHRDNKQNNKKDNKDE